MHSLFTAVSSDPYRSIWRCGNNLKKESGGGHIKAGAVIICQKVRDLETSKALFLK